MPERKGFPLSTRAELEGLKLKQRYDRKVRPLPLVHHAFHVLKALELLRMYGLLIRYKGGAVDRRRTAHGCR